MCKISENEYEYEGYIICALEPIQTDNLSKPMDMVILFKENTDISLPVDKNIRSIADAIKYIDSLH